MSDIAVTMGERGRHVFNTAKALHALAVEYSQLCEEYDVLASLKLGQTKSMTLHISGNTGGGKTRQRTYQLNPDQYDFFAEGQMRYIAERMDTVMKQMQVLKEEI